MNNPTTKLYTFFLTQAVSFPLGMASSTRLRLLARCLADQEGDVTVLIMKGTENQSTNSGNSSIRGNYHGVSFEYMPGTTTRPSNFWVRRYYEAKGILKTIFRIYQKKRDNQLDVLIFYTRNHRIISFFSKLCHALKIPVVLELCEWPLAQTAVHGKKTKAAAKFCNTILGKVDAVLPISSFIEEKVQEYQRQHSQTLPSLQIPILIESGQFLDNQVYDENSIPYCLYCGSLNYRAIIETLIETAQELKKKGTSCIIKILGGHSSIKDKLWLRRLIIDNGISDYIELIPYLNNTDFHEIQQKACALLAPLPNDQQTRSRFPTKIGEYLASSRPLIVTPYGEASRYLTHGETALITKNNTAEAIANTIVDVLNNPNVANIIGQNGREFANNTFNYTVHSKKLSLFLHKIKKDAK